MLWRGVCERATWALRFKSARLVGHNCCICAEALSKTIPFGLSATMLRMAMINLYLTSRMSRPWPFVGGGVRRGSSWATPTRISASDRRLLPRRATARATQEVRRCNAREIAAESIVPSRVSAVLHSFFRLLRIHREDAGRTTAAGSGALGCRGSGRCPARLA